MPGTNPKIADIVSELDSSFSINAAMAASKNRPGIQTGNSGLSSQPQSLSALETLNKVMNGNGLSIGQAGSPSIGQPLPSKPNSQPYIPQGLGNAESSQVPPGFGNTESGQVPPGFGPDMNGFGLDPDSLPGIDDLFSGAGDPTDTLKSNINNPPPMGSTLNGIDLSTDLAGPSMGAPGGNDMLDANMDASLEMPSPGSQDEIGYNSENLEEAASEEVSMKNKAVQIIAVTAFAIVLLILLFTVASRTLNKALSKGLEGDDSESEKYTDQEEYDPEYSEVPVYNGPIIQQASPKALAITPQLYTDLMAITKVIQVEDGTVECYVVGTPKNFGSKIKIHIDHTVYNELQDADFVEIEYNIVRISGKDYTTNAKVIKKVVEK